MRKKYNAKSKTTSVHIQATINGKSKFIKHIGKASNEEELARLVFEAQQYISEANTDKDQLSFFFGEDQSFEEKVIKSLPAPELENYGIQRILGTIFDSMGYKEINEELFKLLVLYRIAYPVSKLKTTFYILRDYKKEISADSIYLFLDRISNKYQSAIEKIAYEHTIKRIGALTVLFYDMTTIYFETEEEDDLRKIGFSKDGKFQCPQIVLGLLIAQDGYPVGYDIYQGNESEGRTLIPIIKSLVEKYSINQPLTVVADSGLLSKDNLNQLGQEGFNFIIGARIKNETKKIKTEILAQKASLKDGESFEIVKNDDLRLIVNYSDKRAFKDEKTRKKGLARLEKKLKSSKQVKSFINQRGYNKFLKLDVDHAVEIDEEKILEDKKWDGLKGYVTNSNLSFNEIITQYSQLWKIEKAFRISKTDLRIRPVYHYKEKRIKAHICISFVAYSVVRELEHILKKNNCKLSVDTAIDELKTIYKIIFTPKNGKRFSVFASLTQNQENLLKLFENLS